MGISSLIRREENSDSGRFLQAMTTFDSDGGVELSQLRPGTILEVQTRNSTYTVIPQERGELLIWGNAHYCPEPVKISSLGSCYATGVLRKDYIGLGMRLSFRIADHHITTSRILKIQPKPRN